MAVFVYKATDASQSAVNGTISADTPRQARDILRARGLFVQTLAEQRLAVRFQWWTRLRSARYRHQWVSSIQDLAMLLGAGLPILEALDTIADQHRGHFQLAMIAVRDRVAAGAGLADALKERPDLFDQLSIHLIEVGENSGRLELVLDRLADFKQRMLQFKDRVLTALIYPMFLVGFGIAAAIFLMTVVLPPLLVNLQESVETLPWPTRVVQWCSGTLVSYRWLLGTSAVMSAAALFAALQTDRGRMNWHRIQLKIPLLGPVILKQSISRTAMVIATLCQSGVVLTEALELAARSSGNGVLKQAFLDCAKRVGTGQNGAEALTNSGQFPPLVVRVFSVGQESGQLPEMLSRLASDYDRQVSRFSARIAALLEPVMIVILAFFVGFLLLATILPILEAGNVL